MESRIKFSLNTQIVVLIVAIAMWIFLGIVSPYFFTTGNIQSVMRQMTIQGILGIAEVMVIITAGIDLSVGGVVAFVNIVMSKMVSTGSNIASTILLVMMLSALIGLANGMIV